MSELELQNNRRDEENNRQARDLEQKVLSEIRLAEETRILSRQLNESRAMTTVKEDTVSQGRHSESRKDSERAQGRNTPPPNIQNEWSTSSKVVIGLLVVAVSFGAGLMIGSALGCQICFPNLLVKSAGTIATAIPHVLQFIAAKL